MNSAAPDLFASDPVNIMRNHADQFTRDFVDWLPSNMHIFNAFSNEAFKLIKMGREHYSAYTIVEFLRHHTALTETTGEWKINNNYRPYLARLFGLCHPQRAYFFELRETKKVKQEQGISDEV